MTLWQRSRYLVVCAAVGLVTVVGSLSAQEFLPPEERERGKFWIGLDGFSARVGLELSDDRQGVFGGTVDFGYLGSERLRIRPFGEIGFGGVNDTYLVGADLLFRLTSGPVQEGPYFGLGFGVYGSESCSQLRNCPEVWPVLTVGFDVRLQTRINGLIEYRSEDSFGRHRFFVGLVTRTGG